MIPRTAFYFEPEPCNHCGAIYRRVDLMVHYLQVHEQEAAELWSGLQPDVQWRLYAYLAEEAPTPQSMADGSETNILAKRRQLEI